MSPPRRRKAPRLHTEAPCKSSPTTSCRENLSKGVSSPSPVPEKRRKPNPDTRDRREISCDSENNYTISTPLPIPDKPPRDAKDYRVIELQNGARVVLISELKCGQGRQLNLPYISDSRNVYVGQSGSENKNKAGGKRCTVQEVCANCIKQPWIWGCEDFGIAGDEENRDLFDPYEIAQRTGSFNLPQFPLNSATGGGEDHLVSCAITVGSGYLDEPAKYGGLAHFCEHMVFLGSQAHPEENQLMSIVRLHGGQLNACTMPETTHYYYSILNTKNNEILDRSMDVFSHFFTEPCFSMESIKREINALDHEFRMKRPNDMVCRLEILKQGVRDGHPMKNFFWGDETTLGGDHSEAHYADLRQYLIEFHKAHYVGSNITIALQGSMTLDDLEALALKHFNKIQAGPRPPKHVPEHLSCPFDTNQFNRRYTVKPVGALDTLYLTWALPKSAWSNYRTKPLTYLSTMISSGVKGGLSDFLQEEQFIMGLQCGLQLMSRTKYGVLFVIKLWLTGRGVKYEDEIIKAVFGYLDSLRQKGVSHSVYKRMQDIRDANLMNYGTYRPQLSNAKKLSYCMQLYPSQDILFGDTKFFHFDKASILDVLSELTPNNLNVMVFSHGCGKQEFSHQELNTKCMFDFEDFSPMVVNSWMSKKINCWNVPVKSNPYLTTDFCDLNHQGAQPALLNITESSKLKVSLVPIGLPFPFGYYHVIIRSKDRENTGLRKAMLQLWARILQYELREPISLAEEAGIMSHIQPGPDGKVHVVVYGYDKMAGKLLRDILQMVGKTQCLADEDLFQLSREYLLKVSHCMLLYPTYLAHNLLQRSWKWGENSMLEIHSALVDLTFDEFRTSVHDYLQELKITMVALGNPTLDDVKQLAENLYKFNYKPLDPSCVLYTHQSRMVHLPCTPVTWRVDSLNCNGSTATLVTYFQFGQATISDYFLGFILLRMMAQPMFSELRTQRSLGYAIESGMVYEGGILGALFGITSDADKFSMEELEREQDGFLGRFYQEHLENMSQSEFQQCIAKISGVPMESFSVADLQAFYMKYIMPGSEARRKKLSIQVTGHVSKEAKDQAGNEDECCQQSYDQRMRVKPHKGVTQMFPGSQNSSIFIQNIDQFHSRCSLYPTH